MPRPSHSASTFKRLPASLAERRSIIAFSDLLRLCLVSLCASSPGPAPGFPGSASGLPGQQPEEPLLLAVGTATGSVELVDAASHALAASFAVHPGTPQCGASRGWAPHASSPSRSPRYYLDPLYKQQAVWSF